MIEPTYLSVSQVFQRYICEVPRHQRGYTWDEPQVEDFIRDFQKCIDARGRPHFFGVVAVERQVTSSVLRRCDLIDGQQRIGEQSVRLDARLRVRRRTSGTFRCS